MVPTTITATTTLTTTTAAKCVLDPAVVDDASIGRLQDIGLSFFADLCGRNRGVLILPDDADTYGCTHFPDDYATRAGLIDHPSASVIIIKDANAIPQGLAKGDITAEETVQLLDYFVQNVYASSPKVEEDPYACNVGGLATLVDCPTTTGPTTTTPSSDQDEMPVVLRAATLAGVFTDAPWATGGRRLSIEKARDFYKANDFVEMKSMGLNTVQIPVPSYIFNNAPAVPAVPATTHDHHGPHADDRRQLHPTNHNDDDDNVATTTTTSPWLDLLTDVLTMADQADLRAILVLHEDGPPDDAAVAAAAAYAAAGGRHHNGVVWGLTVPRANALSAARTAAGPHFNLLVPVLQDDLKHMRETMDYRIADDPYVYAALDLGHTGTVADVASSTSADDRMKLFYHESLACVLRAPLEYSSCYQNTKVFVSQGFDLAIDDCVRQKFGGDNTFVDYGQCGRLDETIDSHWWRSHRISFFARQQFSYEQGLGWSFAAWKLYDEEDHKEGGGIVSTRPETLLSLKDVAAAGLVPDGAFGGSSSSDAIRFACLNPPANDFIMGDATLAPVPGPPPDCGNGWWNETIQDCSYWIPPITIPPTPCPTSPSCPELIELPALACPAAPPNPLVIGGLAALIGLVVGAVLGRLTATTRRRDGYQEIAVTV